MNPILAALAGIFLNKKRLIGWGASIAFVVGAIAAGMKTQEFKEAVCGAPEIKVEDSK